MICNLEIIQKDKKVKVKAIIDTGNFLTDPITKMPVVVVEKEKLIDIFPKSVLENTMDFVNGDNTEMEEYLSKIRIIPFKSLGKENGLLLGIKVDGVIINYQGNDNFIKEVIVGIYEKKLSSNNSYSALIGLNILEKGYSLVTRNDKVIKKSQDLKPDDIIFIKMKEGSVTASIKEVL